LRRHVKLRPQQAQILVGKWGLLCMCVRFLCYCIRLQRLVGSLKCPKLGDKQRGKEKRVTDNRLYALLAYAGTLPFAACAILPIVGIPGIAGVGSCAQIAAGYGLAITSFMAGVHWGTHLYRSPGIPVNLMVTSNAITVVVWLAFALAPATVSIAVTGSAFLLLLAIDYRLANAGLITKAYLALRRNVTFIVAALLALTVALA